jgi:2-polyprenyl-3-methyl-5-hydroxy-6-metoxy-1,4-benzoquinol methylase
MSQDSLTTAHIEIISNQQSNQIEDIYRWIFENIRPYIQGRVIEIGSGSGNIATIMVENKIPIHLNDTEEHHINMLQNKFNGSSLIRSINKVDFKKTNFENEYRRLAKTFNTVLSLNITEHNPLSQLAITNMKLVLVDRGILIMMAPAYTAIYNGLEVDLNDWKEYNYLSIKQILGNGFEILRLRYLNLPDDSQNRITSHCGLSVLAVARKVKVTNK